MNTLAVLTLAAAILGASTAFAADEGAKPAKSCLFANRVDGFSNAKRDSIVLTDGRDRWQAEVMGAFGLENAETVATVAHTTCLSEGDTLKFRAPGGGIQSVMITKLTYLGKPERKTD